MGASLREAFVLGAGFSRAVSDAMPTLNSLGENLRKSLLAAIEYSGNIPHAVRLQLIAGRIPFDNLELWLSSLAERQPYMIGSDSLRNRALFEDITQLLVLLVADAESNVAQSPGWLRRLLRLWHRRQSTVITFNYDTIVESTAVQLGFPSADGDIVSSILGQLPRLAIPLQVNELPVSFHLLKLHGSLDWYWNPDDQSGESLCRLPTDNYDAQARAAVAGKRPFIVPPLVTKASFYSLGLLRELWRNAAMALQRAESVTVIGYSVPLSDLATAAMLAEAGRSYGWHIVNPEAASVSERLSHLRVDVLEAHQSTEEWVDWYEEVHCHEMSRDLLYQLQRFRNEQMRFAPIQLRRSRHDLQVARRLSADRNQVLIEAAPMKQGEVLEASLPHEPDLVDLLRGLDSPRPVRAQLEGVDGLHEVLGAMDPSSGSIRGSYANLHWCAIEVQDVPSR
jgi:hypothetical protein